MPNRPFKISNFISRYIQMGLIGVYLILPSIALHSSPRLRGVAIEPTNYCNLKCGICYSQNPKLSAPRPKGYMDLDVYKIIIDELSELRFPPSLGLNFGGESLCHPVFMEMVRYAVKKGCFDINFNTNGMLLSDEINDLIIRNGIEVSISLDGLKSYAESNRKGSDYTQIETNILNLIKLRGQSISPSIRINLVEYKQSIEEIRSFIEFWTKVVDAVTVTPFMREDFQFGNRSFFDSSSRSLRVCSFPFSYMGILWNGDAVLCCHDIAGRATIGNVKENGIMGLWTSKTYRILRNYALKGSFPASTPCSKCDLWNISFRKRTERYQEDIYVDFIGQCKKYYRKRVVT